MMMKQALHYVLASNAYAAFVVGFAIMTDSMVYTMALPFLPDMFERRLHVPDEKISKWSALCFEVFAFATLLSNLVVGYFADASSSKAQPFMLSVIIMLSATILFFVGTTPLPILISRAIQGASTTFTWITGLAFLVDKVGEDDLGGFVGWTTVGVAVGEIVGPFIGGPIYDYGGHWAAFGAVQGLLLIDILLRVLARDDKGKLGIDVLQEEEEGEEDAGRPLMGGETSLASYRTVSESAKLEGSHTSVASGLVWNWVETLVALVFIFMVRCAMENVVPMYLTKKYSWTPTKISMALLTLLLPQAANPIVGKLTSRHGPRWWSTAGFGVCGFTFISFGQVTETSTESQIAFVAHLAVIGTCVAVVVNANQVAISVASQRYGVAKSQALDNGEELKKILNYIGPRTMLSGVTTSWAAGSLLGPAYSSVFAYTEVSGWQTMCLGLGGLCLVAVVANVFLWRKW